MTHVRFGAIAVSILVSALVSASALATNFPYTLQGPTLGVSLSGTYLIALPATTTSPTAIANCDDLRLVINAGGVGVASVVRRLDRATDNFVTCSCPGPNCFTIDPGEGYEVQLAANSSFTIVGEDAFVMIPIRGIGNNSASGTNLVALPFSTTLVDAEGLLRAIDFNTTQNVQRYITATHTFQTYTGRKAGGLAFPLADGAGYISKNTDTRYFAAPGPAMGCSGNTGSFGASLTAAGLATAFCTSWTDTDYSCSPSGAVVTLTNVNTSSSCYLGTITLTFIVPGGTTTAAHPYGYKLCCNSPLSNAMGTDGNPLVSINNTTQSFGEFSVQTVIHDAPSGSVPAVGWGGMIALVLALLAIGIYSRMR